MTLYYGDIVVGDIAKAFCDDTTWSGVLKPAITVADGPLQKQLLDFIAVSEDWNERVRRDEEADPDEFKRYGDLVTSESWTVKRDDRQVDRIATSPVFFRDGEVSWRLRD